MHKLIFVGVLFLILVSCKEKVQEGNQEDAIVQELPTKKWPRKLSVDPKASTILREWPEYNAMDISFDAIYNISNKEDLSLTIENIIEEQKLLEDSEYPIEFDNPQIKSRQKVFKTYVLKVKGDLIYRLNPQESVLEMINAYNTLRKQFNVIVNNTFDSKLLLDE